MSSQALKRPSGLHRLLPRNPRRDYRYPCDLDVTCYTFDADPPARWSAHVKDISSSGIALVMDWPIMPLTVLGIELTSLDQSFSYLLVARVVRRAPHTAGRWLLGCSFERSLTDYELANLL
jgi:hypothetical protein